MVIPPKREDKEFWQQSHTENISRIPMANLIEHKTSMDEIQVIELKMMDKRKYFPLTLASGLTIRSLLYPFMLIKTRLQIQKGNTVYRGTFDAFLKIAINEGRSGLYRGFWVSCLQLFPSMAYISAYEGTRHYLSEHMNIQDNRIRSFIGGGVASTVGQTLAVPIDIVTQHLMLMGAGESSGKGHHKLQHFHISGSESMNSYGAVRAIVKAVYGKYGLSGFYKGYFVSLACFTPNSALWWFFYDHYCVMLSSITPSHVPLLAIQIVAAPLGGVSSAVITNPLDVVRARIQVEGKDFGQSVKLLWKEEGVWMATKGLTARLIQSVTFSFFIMLGYETIKRWSVLDEYKDQIRW